MVPIEAIRVDAIKQEERTPLGLNMTRRQIMY